MRARIGYVRLGRQRKPIENSDLQAEMRRQQLCKEEVRRWPGRVVVEVQELFLLLGILLACNALWLAPSHHSDFRFSAICSDLPDLLAKLNFSTFASHFLPTTLIYFFRALITI